MRPGAVLLDRLALERPVAAGSLSRGTATLGTSRPRSASSAVSRVRSKAVVTHEVERLVAEPLTEFARLSDAPPR